MRHASGRVEREHFDDHRAPDVAIPQRDALCADAVKFATSLGYVNAGTVEFLLATEGERAGQHVFIEMNPRIQVEHTVTEEVTDIDIVSAQMRIASGETLEEIGVRQEQVRVNGFAIQTRITTEDPTNGFLPDTGRIVAYRSPGGAGVRLDGATAMAGNSVTGHFDSMLVKLTCRGRDFETAVARASRALAEFVAHLTRLNRGRAFYATPEHLGEYVLVDFVSRRTKRSPARARTGSCRMTRAGR